ncbi:hypothetical protein [Haladaptatus sp. CMAA 1911]|uniref:hypothetical protein n=1 Tax=unclassified Haladaptatus TaxID=2622732 RepID=UPI0037542A86
MSRQSTLSDMAAQETLTECRMYRSRVTRYRRQRPAGATKYDPANGEITISLAWDSFEQHGWEQFSSIVRHELIYAWRYHEFGDADSG